MIFEFIIFLGGIYIVSFCIYRVCKEGDYDDYD